MNPEHLGSCLCADLVITSTNTGDIASDEWKEPYMRLVYHMQGHSYYKALKDIYFAECDLYVKAGNHFDIDWFSVGPNRVILSFEPAT